MSSDCIFCKLVAGEIPSTKVYEDEYVYAFDDIEPEAPVHVLVVPKTHYHELNDEVPAEALGHIMAAIPRSRALTSRVSAALSTLARILLRPCRICMCMSSAVPRWVARPSRVPGANRLANAIECFSVGHVAARVACPFACPLIFAIMRQACEHGGGDTRTPRGRTRICRAPCAIGHHAAYVQSLYSKRNGTRI